MSTLTHYVRDEQLHGLRVVCGGWPADSIEAHQRVAWNERGSRQVTCERCNQAGAADVPTNPDAWPVSRDIKTAADLLTCVRAWQGRIVCRPAQAKLVVKGSGGAEETLTGGWEVTLYPDTRQVPEPHPCKGYAADVLEAGRLAMRELAEHIEKRARDVAYAQAQMTRELNALRRGERLAT